MVTLIGLGFLFLPIGFCVFYDLNFSHDIPFWLNILMFFCIFMGQLFDAADGKHARNTQRSSSLGQLMDHGCDAISNSWITIMVIQSLKIGNGYQTILVQLLAQVQSII